ATTFGIDAPAHFTVEAFVDDQHPSIPSRIDYVFRKDPLRDVLAFLARFIRDRLTYPFSVITQCFI
ncbi:MAG: hypothetical protein Q7U57_15270, partial [Methylovulum sp.]|nr:hypothetical protein [Methylovulum sp.]